MTYAPPEIDREIIRKKIYQQWKVKLPDNDLMWIFVDVMEETNRQLLRRTQKFIQNEVKHILAENRQIFFQENEKMIRLIVQKLQKEIAHKARVHMEMSLSQAQDIMDRQNMMVEERLTENEAGDQQKIVGLTPYVVMAFYGAVFMMAAIIIFKVATHFL